MVKRTLLLLFIVNILSYVCILTFTYYTADSVNVHSYFIGRWVVTKSLTTFIENLLPLQCTAIILTFSAFFVAPPSGAFYKIVTPCLGIFFALAFSVFLLKEWYLPGAYKDLSEWEINTIQAARYLERAKETGAQGDFKQSALNLDRYLSLIPADMEYRAIRESLNDKIQESFLMVDIATGDVPSVIGDRVLDQDPNELVSMAHQYYLDGDYYSSYYYSSLAYQVDNSLGQARDIASDAYSQIASLASKDPEQTNLQIFEQKMAGTEALIHGRPVEAYFIFNELKIFMQDMGLPEDPEIDIHLERTVEAFNKVRYFTPDIEIVETTAGINDIAFANTGENGNRELIFISKLSSHQGKTMIRDLECIRFTPEDVVQFHIYVPYAKLSGNQLILIGQDTDSSDPVYQPEFIYGSAPRSGLITLTIELDRFDLQFFQRNIEMSEFSITDLWQAATYPDKFGRFSTEIRLEFILRVVFIFVFLEGTLFAIILGWTLKRRGKRIPLTSLLIFPILPFFSSVLYIFAMYLNRIVFSFLIMLTGFYFSFSFVFILHAVLLLILILVVSIQNSEV